MAAITDDTDKMALAPPSNDPSFRPVAFDFKGTPLRVITIDGEPWFVARDVALLLGYERTADAVRTHCKGSVKRRLPTAGGEQDVTLIPERDLYRLVLRSKLPSAEAFEEWVVAEVLPAIRKTGRYGAPALPDFTNPVTAARAWADAIEAKQRAEVLATDRAILIEQQKPAVDFVERYVNCEGNHGFRATAKLLKANEREFRAFLFERKIMYRLEGKLMAHAPHLAAGRFHVDTKTVQEDKAVNECKFTPKGVQWIAGEWAKRGVQRALTLV